MSRVTNLLIYILIGVLLVVGILLRMPKQIQLSFEDELERRINNGNISVIQTPDSTFIQLDYYNQDSIRIFNFEVIDSIGNFKVFYNID